MKNNKK